MRVPSDKRIIPRPLVDVAACCHSFLCGHLAQYFDFYNVEGPAIQIRQISQTQWAIALLFGLFDHLRGGGDRVLVGDGHSCCLGGGLLGHGLTGDLAAFHGGIDPPCLSP